MSKVSAELGDDESPVRRLQTRVEGPQQPKSQEELIGESIRRRGQRARRETVIVRSGQVLLLGLILGSWEISSRSGWLSNADIFYSRPSEVGAFLADNRTILWEHTWVTTRASIYGAGSGIILGVLAGLLLGQFDKTNRILDPVTTILAGLPRIALAPLFLLWFGITEEAKVFLAFSIVFFIMLFNARAGVKSVEPGLLTQARLVGARTYQVFWKVTLPSAVPVIFGGFRLAVAFGFLGVIASEMVAARQGLGILVVTYGQSLEPAGVFAVLAILAVIMSLLNTVIALGERRLMRWRADT